MNTLALELNREIQEENPVVYEFLSSFGQSIYYPKGILSQSAEAKQKAQKFNATLGIATDSQGPLSLPSFDAYFNHLDKKEIYNYSPSFGNQALREAWKKRMVKLNPALTLMNISTPVVTAGLTQGHSLVCELFFAKEDKVILPNQIWGNYRLLYQVRGGVQFETFDFFKNKAFNLQGFDECLSKEIQANNTAKIILNFPNNPTGYSLTDEEIEGMKTILFKYLNKGARLLIILDDAYYGLFFENNIPSESLFSHLATMHPNLLAIKIDGMTKEYFAWGLRIGFITFGSKIINKSYSALEKKVAGAIRANISNCSTAAQNILLKSLMRGDIDKEAQKNLRILKDRGNEVKKVLKDPKFIEEFEPYPFNSGYFMLIKLKKVNAEPLRVHLLDKYGVGTISTAKQDLRIAFSCVEKENIAELFDIILMGCKDLQSV